MDDALEQSGELMSAAGACRGATLLLQHRLYALQGVGRPPAALQQRMTRHLERACDFIMRVADRALALKRQRDREGKL